MTKGELERGRKKVSGEGEGMTDEKRGGWERGREKAFWSPQVGTASLILMDVESHS